MPNPIRAQVILHTDDAIAANYVTNSWCIDCTDFPSSAEIIDYTAAFATFYSSLVTFLGGDLAQNGHEIKYYDLLQTVPPNYPIEIDTFNLTSGPTTDPLPSEVALCLSFQGSKVPGSPQNRRRGRVYIGTLNTTYTAGGRPASSIMTAMANAAEQLSEDLNTSSNVAYLSVWSQMDGAAVHVTDGWIDNAYDTQRRRGVERTSRTTWTT